MRFEFKILKRGLKVTEYCQDGSVWGGKPYKLTLHAWAAIENVKPPTYFTKSGRSELEDKLQVSHSISNGTATLLEREGLVESIERRVANARFSPLRFRLILTERAVALRAAMPPCPDRADWPEVKRSTTSPTNVRLTETQQKLINSWTTTRTLAVPLGGTEMEESRWVTDHGIRPTLKALLRMGLVEPGISGVMVRDGVVTTVMTPERVVSDDVGVVYRLTVRGALMSDTCGV